MDEKLKNLRSRLLFFRWLGITLGVLAFPAPLVLIAAGVNGASAFTAVPFMVLTGIGCMIAGIVTRGQIKFRRGELQQLAATPQVQEQAQAETDPPAEIRPVAKLKASGKDAE
jgi:hypothetical protein